MVWAPPADGAGVHSTRRPLTPPPPPNAPPPRGLGGRAVAVVVLWGGGAGRCVGLCRGPAPPPLVPTKRPPPEVLCVVPEGVRGGGGTQHRFGYPHFSDGAPTPPAPFVPRGVRGAEPPPTTRRSAPPSCRVLRPHLRTSPGQGPGGVRFGGGEGLMVHWPMSQRRRGSSDRDKPFSLPPAEVPCCPTPPDVPPPPPPPRRVGGGGKWQSWGGPHPPTPSALVPRSVPHQRPWPCRRGTPPAAAGG